MRSSGSASPEIEALIYEPHVDDSFHLLHVDQADHQYGVGKFDPHSAVMVQRERFVLELPVRRLGCGQASKLRVCLDSA